MEALMRALNVAGVRYLLIGGQAMRLHGMPRFSVDWDIFIPRDDPANLAQLNGVLARFCDESVQPLGPKGEGFVQTLQTNLGLVQFHLGLPGVPDFGVAETRAVERRDENGCPMRCLCATDLLASKRAADRSQDQQDILYLQELLRTPSDADR